MNPPSEQAQKKQSEFSKKLAANPGLRTRCNDALKVLREAASEDIVAVERSERLTSEDLAVYINARADNSLPESG